MAERKMTPSATRSELGSCHPNARRSAIEGSIADKRIAAQPRLRNGRSAAGADAEFWMDVTSPVAKYGLAES